MKTKHLLAASVGAVSLLSASAALAQVNVGGAVSASASGIVPASVSASTTVRERLEARYGTTSPSAIRADAEASTSAARQANLDKRMGTMRDRGNDEITARVDSLDRLLSRIGDMAKISSANKAALTASVNVDIAAMDSLEAAIQGDTSTTTLHSDVGSITKAYRIYALVIPQVEIAAAADRAIDIAGELNTVAAKIQAAAGSNPAAASALADLAAKTADAQAQANAAVSETASLQPDNGDSSVASSNQAALKDARSKLQTAAQDLKAAEQDAKAAAKAIRGSGSVTASSTVSASTTNE